MSEITMLKLPYLGLSPALAEKILQMDILPDAKLILMVMAHHGIVTSTFQQLERLLNCPLNEIDTARACLSADRININRQSNMITLSDEWKQLVKVNKDVQLQGGASATYPPDESDPESGDPETDSSGVEQGAPDKRV